MMNRQNLEKEMLAETNKRDISAKANTSSH